ncbi:hypothetical protein [Algoriphagus sp. Y33]|uniref:hypothetical protein n=1 Tax=Algoriphagus sp. Y33 TaxID=2772483 RepID=UPI00177E7E5E|nr:hypothetical protein [Algoriphagus sp. Y33]
MQNKKLDSLIASAEIEFDLKAVFSKAWEMYKSQALMNSSYMLLLLSLQGMVVLYAPQFTLVYSLALAPPLYTGFFLVANKMSGGEKVTYGDYFMGFNYWMLMFSIWLIGQVLVSLGLILFIVPGIYLAVSYMFAVLFGIFGGFSFWNSLEYSRKLVSRNFWQFFVLAVILVLVNVVPAGLPFLFPSGGVIFALWICVSLPVSFMAIYVIFEDLTRDVFSEEEKTSELTHV